MARPGAASGSFTRRSYSNVTQHDTFLPRRRDKVSTAMNILYLILTILFEVSGTTSLKLSQGFTKLVPSIAVVVFYGLSFYFLSLTLKKLEIGVIYAIWSG